MVKAKIMGKEHFKDSSVSIAGIALVLIGVVWFASEVGWIPEGFPIWPLVVIIIGIALVVKKSKCCSLN